MKYFYLMPIVTLLFTVACQQKAPICPLHHGEWEFVETYSDEFNQQALDTSKWYPYNPTWKGRKPGFFSKENVEVTNGELILTSKTEDLPNLPEGYHTFTTAAVQSKERMLYGYYEIRCKPMKSRCSSAFWFYYEEPELWTEIDVFEICGKHPDEGYDQTYFATTHVLRAPETGDTLKSDHVAWKSPTPLADDYLISGLEWRKDSLIWYVDGEVIRKRENTKWHQALTLNFDSETMPAWFGMPEESDPEGKYRIDYIRAWKRVTSNQ